MVEEGTTTKLKKKKFQPRKNFRFLRGAISDQANIADLKLYNDHRLRCFLSIAKVDTKPLKLNPRRWLNARKLNDDVKRTLEIDRQNKDLLKKINIINRTKGKVDTYNPEAYQRSNHWQLHELTMKRIEWENKQLYKCILKTVSLYDNKMLKMDWNTNLKKLKHSCLFPLVIDKKVDVDEALLSEPSISEHLEKSNADRPLCFLEFRVIHGEYLGRLVIELYYDHAPVTVQNFMSICQGEDGLTYKNCLVYRIVKDQYMETGDITKNNGRGGFSIYGETFPEENHMLRHTKAGVVSMKRVPPTENNSQFCITFSKMDQLDHKNVVFGKVIKGCENLFKIKHYGRKIGKPYADIIISDCGSCRENNSKMPRESHW